MRKGRLFQLLCHLLENGQSTAAAISKEFGVSVRTVYRDVETLNAAGIPIYAETGRHGGICLMKGFMLDQAVLSEGDRRSILETVKANEAEYREPGTAALQKLAGLFDLPGEEWLETRLPSEEGVPGPDDRIQFLRRAITQRRQVALTMADSEEGPYRVQALPLKLCCREDGWYLRTLVMPGREHRLLPLAYMSKWKPTSESFEPIPCPEEAPSEGGPAVRVVLKFPSDMAHEVFAAFDCTLIHRRRDGGLELRRDMPIDAALINKLLALGPRVNISAPAELREQVAQKAKALYEANK